MHHVQYAQYFEWYASSKQYANKWVKYAQYVPQALCVICKCICRIICKQNCTTWKICTGDDMQNNLYNNMPAICKFICIICKTRCNICKIYKPDFNMQNMHSPLCWCGSPNAQLPRLPASESHRLELEITAIPGPGLRVGPLVLQFILMIWVPGPVWARTGVRTVMRLRLWIMITLTWLWWDFKFRD